MAYRTGIALLSIVLFGGFVVGFVQHSISEDNKQWCELFVLLTKPPPTPPQIQATTPVGKEIVQYNRDKAEYEKSIVRSLNNLSHNKGCNN
jgi:hypothetical protein